VAVSSSTSRSGSENAQRALADPCDLQALRLVEDDTTALLTDTFNRTSKLSKLAFRAIFPNKRGW